MATDVKFTIGSTGGLNRQFYPVLLRAAHNTFKKTLFNSMIPTGGLIILNASWQWTF